MGAETGWRYYAAVVASGVSLVGWIGAVVGTGYVGYRLVTGASVARFVLLSAGAVVVGAAFAMIERRLYEREGA